MLLLRWPTVLLTFLGIFVVVAAIYLSPDRRGFGTHEQLGLAPCAYLARTGKPCLTCGMTTSFALSARGRLPSAYASNALGPPLFAVFVFLAIRGAFALRTGGLHFTRSSLRVLLVMELPLIGIALLQHFPPR